MHYHPLIGITIFIIAVVLSFILGRLYIKKKLKIFSNSQHKSNSTPPKGEVTSPDAPWLDKH